ncbi:MAG: hypothetical protein LBW77_07610, partial [Verrucomicrobiota bacterium]|nr:hypothetical protein [Verrucomicrobiota bacterium]
MKKIILLSAALLTTALLTTVLRAADIQKADNALPLDDPASWLSSAPPSLADVAVFGPATTRASDTVALPADTAWRGIKLSAGAAPWTLDGPGTLSLGSSGVNLLDGAARLTLAPSLGIALTYAQTWTAPAAGTLTAAGPISGAFGITKTGIGTLELLGENTFSGGFSLGNNGTSNTSANDTATEGSHGFVVVGSSSALGTGSVSIRGAQLRAAVPGLSLPNPL